MDHKEMNTTASGIKAILLSLSAYFLMMLWGMMTGMIIAIIGSFCYLAFIFPLMMGFAGKNMVDDVMKRGWIRTSRQKVIGAVLMVIAMFATLHYGRYFALQVQTSLELFGDLSHATEQESLAIAKTVVNYGLKEETGRTGFIGYMLYRAETGISLGRFYSDNRLTLNSFLAWLYWLLEMGIVLWIILGLKSRPQRGPKCEACGSRLGPEKHLGGTSPANEARLLELIERKDMVELGKLIEKDTGLPSLEVYLQKCDACERGVSHITVRRTSQGARGLLQFSDISTVLLQPADRERFLQAIQIGS